MIRQVRMWELYTDATGVLTPRLTPVFAFGTHPQVESDDEAHPVTSATTQDNEMRIIMDELLIGNNLEEIKCRGVVDEDQFDTVALGTTPDDIARCAVSRDVLPTSCPGTFTHAVCICKLDAGCGEAAKGEPVGVLDINQDGAADDTRFQAGALGIQCGSIAVPIDLDASYWNPSGDQNVPALGGFDALGPAIVLQAGVPAGAPTGVASVLPTNTTCKLTVDPSVVDKQGNQLCAPPDGDITKACTPGNLDAFSFKVSALTVDNTAFDDGATAISRTDNVVLKFSAPVTPSTLSGITVTQGAAAYTQFTVTALNATDIRLTWTAAGGLNANQQYTISVAATITDLYGQAMPMPASYTFTTGM
jgi:hypothetical protein